MNRKLYTDVLIIGGGVIGIASGSSGACDGFIFLQSKKDNDIIKLTLESLKIFGGLSDELSYDIEFRKCGGLVISTNSNLGRNLNFSTAGENNNHKVNIEKLDLGELREVEPFISEKAVEATYCSEEAQVNPINLNFGFIEAAKKNGAKILTYEEVVSFGLQSEGGDLDKKIANKKMLKKNKIKKVHTSSGREIIAKEAVCACGAWSKELGSMVGLEIPVIPRKGNLIVTEALPEVINHVILDFDYLYCKYEEGRYTGFTIEQTKNGNLLIGSTREFAGFNDEVDFNKLSKVVNKAREIFPFLKEVSIIRTFCGFRPYSADFLPLVGKAPGFDNFWLATGHEGDGIALSPITGLLTSKMIADKINSRKVLNNFLNINLEKFSPERI